MSQKEATQRRRYSPEVRRAMILDEAAEIISREGVANLSLEGIGQQAGVSKSLVYNYFGSLLELMNCLLFQCMAAHMKLRQRWHLPYLWWFRTFGVIGIIVCRVCWLYWL